MARWQHLLLHPARTGTGLTGSVWTPDLIGVAVLAVAITCGLWWTYFPRGKPALEHALSSCSGSRQSKMARDAFSLVHFLMIGGIVSYAAAIAEMAAHPSDPVEIGGRLALALGLLLFVGGMAVAICAPSAASSWRELS
jgi:low temperature requirement protein LtrA